MQVGQLLCCLPAPQDRFSRVEAHIICISHALNMHNQLSSKARDLNFGKSLSPFSYCVSVSTEH